jgi:D-glycero-alpha-D-manno-heptose-7-phosphate kinase
MTALHVRVPLRISFGGGGTDVDTYFAKFGGIVVSTSIAKYCHVVIEPAQTGVEIASINYGRSVRRSTPTEIPAEAPFVLARAVLSEMWPGTAGGVRVSLGAEVLAGSGMGTSCALVVALCKAVALMLDGDVSGPSLAEMAYRIDTEVAGQASGKQDHYAAACGGLNVIEFLPGEVVVTPMDVSKVLRSRLEEHTMLFFDGRTRAAATVLADQRAAARSPGATLDALHSVKRIATGMVDALRVGDLDGFCRLLGESWEEKKRFSPRVTTPHIDRAVDAARRAGALGAKIAGAGAGGHLLIMAAPAAHEEVRRVLGELGWAVVPVSFDLRGPTVFRREEQQ